MLSEQFFTHIQFFQIESNLLTTMIQVKNGNAPSNVLVIKDNKHEFFDPQNGNVLNEMGINKICIFLKFF